MFVVFFISEQNSNLTKIEKSNLTLLKNEIEILNLSGNENIFPNIYQDLIYNVLKIMIKKTQLQ